MISAYGGSGISVPWPVIPIHCWRLGITGMDVTPLWWAVSAGRLPQGGNDATHRRQHNVVLSDISREAPDTGITLTKFFRDRLYIITAHHFDSRRIPGGGASSA